MEAVRKKIAENTDQESRKSSRNSNRVPPDYESERYHYRTLLHTRMYPVSNLVPEIGIPDYGVRSFS
jgi:hypothetical protein